MNEVWRSGIDNEGLGWVWKQGATIGFPFSVRNPDRLAMIAERMSKRPETEHPPFYTRELPAELIATDTKEN